jgi:hypothetical protein
MIAGLPGTGIGGIFYLILAAFMPICEFFRMIQKRTHLRRWCLIALQMGFIFGIISLIWAEMWVIKYTIEWLCHAFGNNAITAVGLFGRELTMHQTKMMAYAAASGSFISLGFVFICVHTLRLMVGVNKNRLYDTIELGRLSDFKREIQL